MRRAIATSLPTRLLLFSIAAVGIGRGASAQAPLPSAVRLIDPRQPIVAQPKPGEPGDGNRADGPQLITAGTYAFSPGAASLEDMSAGTTTVLTGNGQNLHSAVTNIGFEFRFDGTAYTQFSVNSNGLARLGSAAISGSDTNNLASSTDAPKIAAFWDALCIGTNGKVHAKVAGSAPNRKLIVEWRNMKITRNGGCTATPGAGTFQLWLFETTGAIEFVYGAGMSGSNDGGYTIGLQSGSAANFASVTTVTSTVSYVASNNTQTDAIAPGTAYTFTPNFPAAPTNLIFSPVHPVDMTLNWTDNASNETGYVIYRSTDNVSFTLDTQTGPNVISQQVTDLTPNTMYFWRVVAVTEGATSSALSGTQTTTTPGSVTSAAAGNWTSPATWLGGSVPSPGDNVTIAAGHTITIDTDATCVGLTIQSSGVLQFEPTTARTLTVSLSAVINAGAVLRSALTGTQTGHVVTIRGNLTNNGTLDLSTNANTAGAALLFTGALNATLSGSGTTTDLRALTVNKGTSIASVLELMPTALTVQGASSDVAGFLTLTSGLLKISGTFALTNRVFATASYTIPAASGLWLNNPNVTVAGQAGGTTTFNNGLLRVTQGTYNVGTGPADGMGTSVAGAVWMIEGGVVNASGRIDPQSEISYTQTGGVVNVGVTGNTRSNFGSFEIFSASSSFTMSGGLINIVNRNTGATPIDYRVYGSTVDITGGTIVVGAAGAPASTAYVVVGNAPNVTVNATMTMTVSNEPLFVQGTSIINNGAIASSGVNARVDLLGNGPITYSGSGTFGTLVTPFGGAGVVAATDALVTLDAPIVVYRVNVVKGGFVHSNQITLGNGGASATVVQIGPFTEPAIFSGWFDVSPVHNQGTGGESLIYVAAGITTSVEINPTRVVTSLQLGADITLAGGDLTLTSSGVALNLGGSVATNENTIILASPTATVTRGNGWVLGNLRKAYASNGSKDFEVGSRTAYSPVTVNVVASNAGAAVTVGAGWGVHPAIATPLTALRRYWTISAVSVLSANLTFSYADPPDVPPGANEAAFVILKYNGTFSAPGGSVNTAANTATINGVTSFSDWTLGTPAPATYSDYPLTPGTVVKAIHLTQLRTAIDAVRAARSLGPFVYSEAVAAGGIVKAMHVAEMRSALAEVYAAAGAQQPFYSTTPAHGVTITVADVAELRTAVARAP